VNNLGRNVTCCAIFCEGDNIFVLTDQLLAMALAGTDRMGLGLALRGFVKMTKMSNVN